MDDEQGIVKICLPFLKICGKLFLINERVLSNLCQHKPKRGVYDDGIRDYTSLLWNR
ncbi:unknown [Roseburia sp. CAG:309]|nr:unknown [Roseburia sp. CAG:309]